MNRYKPYFVAIGICSIPLVFGTLCLSESFAVEAAIQKAEAGASFQPAIGQGTNRILAREVRWVSPDGYPCRTFVIFSAETKQVVMTSSPSKVCFLNGKLYAAEISGVYTFSITKSQRLEASGLPEELAIRIALGTEPLPAPDRKRISVESVVMPDIHKVVPQPIGLKSVELRWNGIELAAYFEAFPHMKGKVVFDQQFNPISTNLINPTIFDEGRRWPDL